MRGLIPFPNISPELFSISIFGFELALRWYALAYIIGILLGWRLAVRAVNNTNLWPNSTPVMKPAQIEDLLTWIILGVILGGRLGYVLFYQPAYYAQNPSEILAVWQGGMAFHGGLLGVVVAGYIYTWRHQIARLSAADLMALGVPPGLLLGRLANFINAELWGRPTDMPWGVAFPTTAAQNCPGIEGICARHPSQLYEAGLEGLLLGAILIWLVWARGALKSPGRVAGVFFAGYGLSRFVVEFFRQPDAQFITAQNPLGLAWHINGVGLTMGQVLSTPMIVLGLWLLLRSRRSTS
ncbi:MAG: prolipoprotein diacylglyceryl transferase [Roseobacter sp.]